MRETLSVPAESTAADYPSATRANLIRDVAESVQPGKASRAFADLLFGHTNLEASLGDLVGN